MKKTICLSLFIALFIAGLSISFSQVPKDENRKYGEYILSDVTKTISLDLEDARLINVLKMLSQQTGINFVSTEAVRERKLTLYLEDVPLKEALDVIFDANNLAYVYEPAANIFVIKEMGRPTIELRTKVYHLRFARVKSSRLEKEIKDKMKSKEEEESESSSKDNKDENKDEDEGGIMAAVEKVLSENGKVTEDPVTNSLIVLDVPVQFALIDEVVAQLDVAPAQVMIEAEILDVEKQLVDKLGFKFTNGLYGSYTGPKIATGFPFKKEHYEKGTAPTGTNTYGVLDFSSTQVIMQFLMTDTSTKFLGRPKIFTVSNQTAEMNLTTDEAIGVSTTTLTDDRQTQKVERTETGTKLRVTPQINLETDEVTLFVEVFNRETTTGAFGVTGQSGATDKVLDPEERGVRSVLRVKNGETLYIGGLIKQTGSDSFYKVPFLGDLPLLGKFFRYKSTDNRKRELLVFLTPHIIDQSSMLAKGSKLLEREQNDPFTKVSASQALDKFSKNK